MTTTGLANCPTGGDPADPRQFCASDAVEPSLSAGADASGSEPNVGSTINPKADSNLDLNADPSPDSWRVEVAARLERYRTRRKPRTPRYPSLLLPFDAPESWSHTAAPSGSATAARAEQSFTVSTSVKEQIEAPCFAEPHHASKRHPSDQDPFQSPEQAPGPSANVIEFPRSAAIPVFHPSDLADPVFDRHRPRIVEAPEILPPPPALGGMLMEAAHKEPVDKRTAADSHPASASPSASIVRRALAALVDGIVLAIALVAFAAIFLRLNPSVIRGLNLSLISVHGPLPILAGAFSMVAVLLWASYKLLFVVYTGSTPGLRTARLRLAGFDGSPLNRRSRRWRVLASFLSAFSAGLGYLWCILDQDGLCWHDRITRTHIESEGPAQ
jgi:uncharacterized RDD family membrane protein YckC